jgi:integrase/recombinase XerD
LPERYSQGVWYSKATYHTTARHTFATTVTLSNGVPVETVSALLGRSSIRTTQIYAKVVAKKIKEDMQLLRHKLDSNKQQY